MDCAPVRMFVHLDDREVAVNGFKIHVLSHLSDLKKLCGAASLAFNSGEDKTSVEKHLQKALTEIYRIKKHLNRTGEAWH